MTSDRYPGRNLLLQSASSIPAGVPKPFAIRPAVNGTGPDLVPVACPVQDLDLVAIEELGNHPRRRGWLLAHGQKTAAGLEIVVARQAVHRAFAILRASGPR